MNSNKKKCNVLYVIFLPKIFSIICNIAKCVCIDGYIIKYICTYLCFRDPKGIMWPNWYDHHTSTLEKMADVNGGVRDEGQVEEERREAEIAAEREREAEERREAAREEEERQEAARGEEERQEAAMEEGREEENEVEENVAGDVVEGMVMRDYGLRKRVRWL